LGLSKSICSLAKATNPQAGNLNEKAKAIIYYSISKNDGFIKKY
jgi:hypothetical protein